MLHGLLGYGFTPLRRVCNPVLLCHFVPLPQISKIPNPYTAILSFGSIQHPISSTQYPIGSIQHPINSTQHPIGSIQHAINSTQHPIDSTQHPICSSQHPISSTQ